MILPKQFKGKEAKHVNPLVSRTRRNFLCLVDEHGQKFYLSWDNLKKILESTDFDVDQKRIRKHLIPLLQNKYRFLNTLG